MDKQQPHGSRRNLLLLTEIRFFAAIHVVIYHFSGKLLRGVSPMGPVVALGSEAVGLFFVLSGFVLAYNYLPSVELNKTFWRKFLASRVGRIYPAYIVGFILATPAVLQYAQRTYTPREAVTKIGAGGVSSLLLLQAWFPRTVSFWNFPGWSLSAEFFFYAAFPIIAAGMRTLRAKGVSIAFVSCSAILALANAFVSHAALSQPPATQQWVQYLPPVRIPEFVLGIVAGRAYLLGERRQFNPLLVIIVALPLVLGMIISPHLPHLVLIAALAPLFAVTILGLACSRDPLEGFPRAQLLGKTLGEASYAIYILQWPIFFLMGLKVETISTPGLILYLSVLTGCSVLTLRYIEQPLRRTVVRFLAGDRERSVVLLPLTAETHAKTSAPEATGLQRY